MAIKELFQDSRPQVLFDPRASQRIDPRFKFTRDGVASYYDKGGVLRYAPANQPRVGFIYEPDENGAFQPAQGLLTEDSATNLLKRSEEFNDAAWFKLDSTITPNTWTSPDATLSGDKLIPETGGQTSSLRQSLTTAGIVTASVFAKAEGITTVRFGALGLGGAQAFNLATGESIGPGFNILHRSITSLGSGVYRCTATWNQTASNTFFIGYDGTIDTADGAKGLLIWGAQLEAGSYPTSYIPTAGATVTRAADLLSIEGTSLPSTGSIYIDARSLTSNVDDTLLSAANASDDKLTLAIRQPASLYNSKALVYEVDGAFKPTLPFPVPTDVRERNLITYGANNYHYRSDSSRLTPSSSSSVPAGMNRLGIGHDVTDPTKAFTGYINTVYLWPGEITPTVAEALVRGDVDPKDADAGVFTPETGALAFVFNTQGTSTDGNTVVQLPLRGSTNNVLVDWGDNTSSSLIGAAASVTVNHTYPSAGIYPVQITADSDGTNSGLQDLQFYLNSPADLVRVLQWGGSTTWNPTTMFRAFSDCTQLDFENAARTNLPDTSAITNWQDAFYNCSSLSGAYPNFNHSAATNLSSTWYNCSSITTFGSSLNDLAVATNYGSAWRGCSSITSFPSITIPTDKGAVTFSNAWQGCSSLESFPPNDGNFDTSEVTNVFSAWSGCSSLAGTFPALNTSKVVSFGFAWSGCSSLTTFPEINTAAGTDFSGAWSNCSSLTTFPEINTAAGTNFAFAWQSCSSLTTFPEINTAAGTSFSSTWRGCSSLTTLPEINTAAGTNFSSAWNGCSSLTIFPEINTAAGTNFSGAWSSCSSLTTFPEINTAAGTNFNGAWSNCFSLTIFPEINTAAGTNFAFAWSGCSSLTTFPEINTAAGTNFSSAWSNCSSLTTFPANFFDSWSGTPINECFYLTWDNCSSLTPASVVNILDSIAASGQSAPSGTGTGDKEITIDWDGTGDPATDAAAAITTLKSRNWQIKLNNVFQ